MKPKPETKPVAAVFVSLKRKLNETINQIMNTTLNFQKTKDRSAKSARRLNFKLVALLASVCIGAGLLLPVIKSHCVKHHAMPPGQFRADMRTLVATVRYLLAAEPVVEEHPAFAAGTSTDFAHLTPNRTLDLPDQSPLQTGPTSGSSTNPPAPI